MISKRKKDEDLRQRLKTSWRKIYRSLLRVDIARTGQVRMSDFMDALHQNDCFVSRDELLKMQKRYGNALYQGDDAHAKQNLLSYERITKDMGLHQSYLEFIQTYQLDTASRGYLNSIRGSQKHAAATRYKQFFRNQRTRNEKSCDQRSGLTLPALKTAAVSGTSEANTPQE